MLSPLKQFLLRSGWKLPYLSFISARTTVILEYHGVPTNGDGKEIDSVDFEQHVIFLKRNFDIIPPHRLWERRAANERIRIILTFDDGFRNNAEVVAPILRRHGLPATFFVCSRHSVPGKYLWFSYCNALEKYFPYKGFTLDGQFLDMSEDQRQISVRQLRQNLLKLTPHPTAMYQAIEERLPPLEDFVHMDELRNRYAGMTPEHVAELAADRLFTIGNHTVDHPFLTRCECEEVTRQVLMNKTWIEQITKQKCDSLAYPNGLYNVAILDKCRQLKIMQGYAETPLFGNIPELEIARVGIYSRSLDILGFKVHWGKPYLKVLRRLNCLSQF